MKGPYPIICRGHSGSRLLAEVFRRNLVWMGNSENPQRDSIEFGQSQPAVRNLVRRGFTYHQLAQAERREVQEAMVELVDGSKSTCPNPGAMLAFGWKMPVMTFTCEIFLDAFPDARTVHLIRDGRDVMLSRLDWRMNRLDQPLNRLVVFGNASVTEYRGRPLDAETVAAWRNEIEMHAWVSAVKFGMRARKYSGRYLEVRYEELCAQPESTIRNIFDFLELPFRQESKQWVKANASTQSIGKWRGREDELADAIAIGAPLLKLLGYD